MAMIFALGIIMLIAIFVMSWAARHMDDWIMRGYKFVHGMINMNRDYHMKMYNE